MLKWLDGKVMDRKFRVVEKVILKLQEWLQYSVTRNQHIWFETTISQLVN